MTSAELAVESAGTGSHITYMIRTEVDMRAFNRWAGSRGLIGRNAFDEGYAMHCLLVESFGEMAPKPFRLIAGRDRRHSAGVLYGYSDSTADHLREVSATFADPLQYEILAPAQIQSKAMPALWQSRQRLGFEVLIRPIVRLGRGSGMAGAERDSFQVEADRHAPGRMRRTREAVYSDWLADRLERHGALLDKNATKLKSFQRVRAVRKRGGRATEGPDAVMHGSLTVMDPIAFADLIRYGLGRHKAYGYGMILLRPPGRVVSS